jgi:protein gp37
MTDLMFPFITVTWNMVAMDCLHGCSYCWATVLKKGKLKDAPRYVELRKMVEQYGSKVKPCILIEKELNRVFKAGDSVFVEDMGDLFGSWVPSDWIRQVFRAISHSNSAAKFLLLTKNPKRYLDFSGQIPQNCICGATIETTESVRAFSQAPSPSERFQAMKELEHPHKMICVEPIVNFEPSKFYHWLTWIPNLEMVVVGYDNYNHHLEEPKLKTTMKLINDLRKAGIHVITKTLREAKP